MPPDCCCWPLIAGVVSKGAPSIRRGCSADSNWRELPCAFSISLVRAYQISSVGSYPSSPKLPSIFFLFLASGSRPSSSATNSAGNALRTASAACSSRRWASRLWARGFGSTVAQRTFRISLLSRSVWQRFQHAWNVNVSFCDTYSDGPLLLSRIGRSPSKNI